MIDAVGPAVVRRDVSRDGTRKFLVRMGDGSEVETVLIPGPRRMTVCISSQAGCALACTFCATGTMGLLRNLTADEIAAQVVLAIEELGERPHPGHPQRRVPVTNVVYMGMGEPLHNLDAVIASLRILTDQRGLAIPPRRITVSTAGLVPQMRTLAAALPVQIAVSLHAPNDEIRSRLMPVNRRWGIAELLAACRELPLGARQSVQFEYVLLDGVNDAPHHADELAAALAGVRAKVNLLWWNEHPGAPFRRPPEERMAAFSQRLHAAGVAVSVRASRGRDIAAACGQLARPSRPAETPPAALGSEEVES